MAQYQVLLMPGEGIGPEIVREGERVLQAIVERYQIDVEISQHLVGIQQFQQSGRYLSLETETLCYQLQTHAHAAILFGAVADEPIGILRKQYDLFANLRPIRTFTATANLSPLCSVRQREIDLFIVRELVSGVYYGNIRHGSDGNGRWAGQELYYHETEIRRIVKWALVIAQQRRKRLHFVHKGNVVKDVFDIWLEVLKQEARSYPEVECQDILVDNMAMQMVLRPHYFDVLLACNMFGDILSDLGAGIVGSIGLLPSASMNEHGFGLFESIGGTAPDIAGQQKANPLSTILSVALLCRYTFHHETAAQAIEKAVNTALLQYRTVDLACQGCKTVSTAEMTDQVLVALNQG
jgi:3-isopropylmalate dehydrogenase